MLETLIKAWQLPDLRRKIMFTVWMFVIFRLGAHIPVPGVNPEGIAALLQQGTLFGFFDIISGGAFKNLSVFAMGITPYINSSIIMQLLTVVIPYLEKLAKEGEEGRKKIVAYTRYGTVILGVIQAIGMAIFLGRSTAGGIPAMVHPSLWNYAVIVVSLSAGTIFLMWMGEMITERGIGNGISLLIFAGIVSRLPSMGYQLVQYVRTGEASIVAFIFFVVMAVVVIGGIVAMNEGQRRIPVQYAKKVVGRRVYGGQSTHIPMRVNQAGVIPVIFAISILLFPSTISAWFPHNAFMAAVTKVFRPGSAFYLSLYALLIIFFTYFYTAVTFNPRDVADNIKKYGGFIPGLRPGRPTAEYIERVLSRITLAGAVFLAIIALLPNFVEVATGMNIAFGGTSLLIVVGVALETMKQLEAQMLMRHYKGFLK